MIKLSEIKVCLVVDTSDFDKALGESNKKVNASGIKNKKYNLGGYKHIILDYVIKQKKPFKVKEINLNEDIVPKARVYKKNGKELNGRIRELFDRSARERKDRNNINKS